MSMPHIGKTCSFCSGEPKFYDGEVGALVAFQWRELLVLRLRRQKVGLRWVVAMEVGVARA